MKTRPEMTDDDIRAYMDFDRLLEIQKQTAVSRKFFSRKYLVIFGLSVGLGIFSWTFFSDADNAVQEGQSVQRSEKPLDNKGLQSATDSLSDTSLPDSSGEPVKEIPKRVSRKSQAAGKKETTVDDDEHKDIGNVKSDVVKQPERSVYVQAAPVHGYPDLYEYFSREFKYPQEAMKDSVRGEVIAVFTINTQGVPEKIVIENSLGESFDKEVVRLIINMPPWKPATYNNKPVASKMSLPLTFQIKKISSPK